MLKKFLMGVASTLTLCAATSALADPLIYQSASFVDYTSPFGNGSNEPAAYFIDNKTYIGAVLQLTSAADVTAIGGYFSELSNGNIFGAIVKDGQLPNLAASALTHVVFAPTGTDQSVSLGSSVHLDAGTYDVVFGSGLFGAAGTSALVTGQSTIGTPILFRSINAGATTAALSSSDVRITVAAAVPEPQSYALFLAGLGLLGFLMRRREAN